MSVVAHPQNILYSMLGYGICYFAGHYSIRFLDHNAVWSGILLYLYIHLHPLSDFSLDPVARKGTRSL